MSKELRTLVFDTKVSEKTQLSAVPMQIDSPTNCYSLFRQILQEMPDLQALGCLEASLGIPAAI